MPRRIITSINIDLKYLWPLTPPAITVLFTDKADDGSETHGRTTLLDGVAAAAFPAGIFDAVNAAIDAQAAAVAQPEALAERIQLADEADARRRIAEAAHAALEAQIAAKQATLAAVDVQLAAKVSL